MWKVWYHERMENAKIKMEIDNSVIKTIPSNEFYISVRHDLYQFFHFTF